MLIALSVDMEGASQLRSVCETFGCMPEYWETGKPRLEADVAVASKASCPTRTCRGCGCASRAN